MCRTRRAKSAQEVQYFASDHHCSGAHGPVTLSANTDPAALAEAVPWIAALSSDARDWLIDEIVPFGLQGGGTLFAAGEPSDALYVLISGSLGAFGSGDGGRLLGQIVAGETVGELGLITGNPRMATVKALRDSELLRLDRSTYEGLAERAPHALVAMARLALERANAPTRTRSAHAGPRTFALLPQHEGLDAHGFARKLDAALTPYGSCVVIGAENGEDHDAAWYSELESQHRYVVYVADAAQSEWRALCLRQADALVFLADAGDQPEPWAEATRGVEAPLPRPEHMVMVHAGKPRLGAARRWGRCLPRARLHHIRGDSDIARLARLMIGRCIGLVLSGGGARGFAHLGVIKALREAGMQIDAVGGTSIGAIIGAGLAADWSTEEMIEIYRRTFVSSNPLNDWTLPLVSLVSGRKVSRRLRDVYGEREIEDLVLPFFCVSANLTDGRIAVHRSGPLWKWLRASVAIPGVLPPVFHRGQVHVDGGIIANLPVDVMHEGLSCDVVAVDIGGDYSLRAELEEFDAPPWWKLVPELFGTRKRPSLLRILLRAGMVNTGAAASAARDGASLLIQPPLAGVDLLDWKAFDRAIEIGYQHALRVIGGPKDALAAETRLLDL